jgi:hypothetical protein
VKALIVVRLLPDRGLQRLSCPNRSVRDW